jgi:hypothetical protein
MATNNKTNLTPVDDQRTAEELRALLAEKEEELTRLRNAAKPAAVPSAYSEDAADLKRRVSIRLPVSGTNKEPLFVRFGDETFTIKRGADVSIPYYVWLHLQECQQADDALSLRMSDLTGSFVNGMELYRL